MQYSDTNIKLQNIIGIDGKPYKVDQFELLILALIMHAVAAK